jgi:hypothetical protein
MQITNKLNLPEEIVNAVSSREPGNSYSASMLTQTPRMVWLRRRHFSEISEDVADRIWALFGTAVHYIFHKNQDKKSLAEEFLEYEFENGIKITGMPDLYKNGKISDWKIKSVWSYVFFDDNTKFELESQLNCYAFLFDKYGFEVKELEAIFILRDWQKSKALYDKKYPQSQVVIIPVRLWDKEEIERHIKFRINNFEKYNIPDNELPECSPAERWAKPGKWALMKKGKKRAIKLYDEKQNFELEPGFFWEERKGEQWKRCEYCSVSSFCNQYLEQKE